MADLAAEGADRVIGRAIDGQDLVADLQSRPFGRRSFQHRVDEVAAVDAHREVADAGVGDARAPEPLVALRLGHVRPAEDGEQDVVVHVVGGQQAGMRGLQLAEQGVDAARGLLEVRRIDHALADLRRALAPADLRQPLLVPELLRGLLHHRVEQLPEFALGWGLRRGSLGAGNRRSPWGCRCDESKPRDQQGISAPCRGQVGYRPPTTARARQKRGHHDLSPPRSRPTVAN